ncbi:MAG: hypothetical protein Kow00108_20860 [Calditrichia bacterium]
METKEFILAMYDVSGIQDFIFSSTKLKDNIGASVMVQHILETDLVEALKKLSGWMTDWKSAKTFEMMKASSNLNAEVIYIGGGNALVAYDSENSYKEATKNLSSLVFEKSRGMLKVVSAFIKTDGKHFAQDRKKLFEKLRTNKMMVYSSVPLSGIAINQSSPADGLPAIKKEKQESLSTATEKKREYEEKTNYEKDLDITKSLPKEFDDINKSDSKKYIGVVHIDGNNMGAGIEKYISQFDNYNDAVQALRTLSNAISEHYKSAMKATCDFVDSKVTSGLKNELDTAYDIPLRIIVLNGDDITFVTHGFLAMAVTEFFLRKVEETPLNLGNETMPVSACAGIAIVKSHFPFFRAYQLAEELAGLAKKKAKAINYENPGSWMDVQVIQTGITTEIEKIRKSAYNLPGKELTPLKNEMNITSERYNLIMRPWSVSERYTSELFSFDNFKRSIKEFSSWPRSRRKNLRNAYMTSVNEVMFTIEKSKSRGYGLPKFADAENGFTDEGQSPYFDALELQDYFVE